MKNTGKYHDRGTGGIFAGLLHFSLVLQWRLKQRQENGSTAWGLQHYKKPGAETDFFHGFKENTQAPLLRQRSSHCKSILRMTSINKFLPWNTTRPPKQNKAFHWLDGQHLLTSRQPQHRATGNRKPHLPPHPAGSTAGSLHQVKSLCSGFHFLYCGCLKISSGKNEVENSINSSKTHTHTSVFANW